jgi:hypothetical protein
MRLLLKTQDMSILSRLQIQYTSKLFIPFAEDTSEFQSILPRVMKVMQREILGKRHCLAET